MGKAVKAEKISWLALVFVSLLMRDVSKSEHFPTKMGDFMIRIVWKKHRYPRNWDEGREAMRDCRETQSGRRKMGFWSANIDLLALRL